jgi:hypothetical protein
VEFIVFVKLFGRYFQTICRIEAYDVPLERYGNCASFSFRLFSEILNGLRADLNILKFVFVNFSVFVLYLCTIFKPLVGLIDMIHRWKAMKNAQLSHANHFSKLLTVLK